MAEKGTKEYLYEGMDELNDQILNVKTKDHIIIAFYRLLELRNDTDNTPSTIIDNKERSEIRNSQHKLAVNLDRAYKKLTGQP